MSISRLPKGLWILILGLVLAPALEAVPTGVPRDPPMPPAGMGRLFGDGQPRVMDCRVVSETATAAELTWQSGFPHNLVSYQRADATWSNWTGVTAPWSCTSVSGCLHSTAQVKVRGCKTANCSGWTEPEHACTIALGVTPNGPPDIVWGGIETTQALAVGCVQHTASEMVFRIKYAGADPASGYPQVGGVAVTEDPAQRGASGAAKLRTYRVAAGWNATDIANGRWSFSVALDGSGTRISQGAVALQAHCLNRPQGSVVGGGGVLTPIAHGNPFTSGVDIQIATGNPNPPFTLTNQALTHNGSAASFGTVTPAGAPGVDTPHQWSETATGRDGEAYTSPALELTAQAMACESDPALAAWWLDPSDDTFDLPDNTSWISGPTLRTDACPASGAAPPAMSGSGTMESQGEVLSVGSILTGWPTRVAALAATGEVNDLFYWWDANWNGGTLLYFFAERPAATTCPAGQRLVSGTCEACPTYQVCSGGSLAAQDWCSAGNPPADATMQSYQSCQAGSTVTLQACVDAGSSPPADAPCTTCPPGERLVSGSCQTCPTYWACDSGGSRALQDWCNAGSPPADATIESYQSCVNHATVTLQACVSPGGSAPADAPCTSCPSGDRLVAGSCEPCPSYWACDGSGNRVLQDWCNAGDPPADATTASHQACQSGTTVTVQACVPPGGSAPADAPCTSCPSGERLVSGSCEPCPTYQVCTSSSAHGPAQWCNAGSPPADATIASYQTCQGGSTVTVQACVAPGGSAPADAPCTSCPSGQRLVAGSCEACPTYWACDGSGNRVRRDWCGAGNPPADATIASYQSCVNHSTVTLQACVAPGGSVPADAPCTSCPSGQRLVAGDCEACPTYDICSGGSLAAQDWCSAGNPPGDATMQSYEACQSGVTVTLQACVAASGTAPADNPCPTSCPSGQRLVSGVCEACPTYQACSGNSLVTRDWCNAGNPPSDAYHARVQYCAGTATAYRNVCITPGDTVPTDDPCPTCDSDERLVDGACEPCPTYAVCNGNHLETRAWCGAGSVPDSAWMASHESCVNHKTVTVQSCVAAGGTAPPDAPCTSCPSGQRLVSGDCETCPTYQVCNGNSLQTADWCNAGNPPGDAWMASHEACVNHKTETVQSCVAAGGTAPADAPCTSCPSGQRLVSGDCEACPTYQACSGNSLVTRDWCNAGSPPGDARMASYRVCSNGSLVTRQACVASGASDPADQPCTSCPSGQRVVAGECEACPTYQVCNGNSLQTADWCNAGNPPGDAWLASHEACVNHKTVTVQACVAAGGTAPPDAPCTSCPSGQRLIAGDCVACPSYLTCHSNGVDLVASDWCGTGSAPGSAYQASYQWCDDGATVSSTVCVNAGGSPPADSPCPPPPVCDCGLAPNWSGGQWVCPTPPPPPPKPACSAGQTWTYNSSSCAWQSGTVSKPSCSAGESVSWNAAICDYEKGTASALACQTGRPRSWNGTSCSYQYGTAVPKPACATGRGAHTWNCASDSWTAGGTVTQPNCRDHTGKIYSGWDSSNCRYTATAVDEPSSCPAEGQYWDWSGTSATNCSWVAAVRSDYCMEGQSRTWDSSACDYDFGTAAACEDDEINNGWLGSICMWDCVVQTPTSSCEDDAPVTPSDCSASPATGFAWSLTSGNLTGVAYADGTGWWAETYNQANPNSGWTSMALCKPCP